MKTHLSSQKLRSFFYQRLCLEAWHINSAHAPLNRADGGLLPDAYSHLVKKRQPISDHIKGPLVAAFRSPWMKALDRSVETLGLWIVTFSVTFIKSVNQCSIKPCLVVHLVAVWALIYSSVVFIAARMSYIRHTCYLFMFFLNNSKRKKKCHKFIDPWTNYQWFIL